MRIAICVPSRGLVYSKTMQSVIEGMQELNKLGIATKYYSSHNLPIPDSHNYCIEAAIADESTNKIIIIEEDMYVFPDAFIALGTSDHDVATLNYNDKNGSPHGIIHYNEQGEVLWSGVGAIAIKREVFEKLGTPYFRTDTRYKIKKKYIKDDKTITEYEEIEARQAWDETKNKFLEVKEDYKYGGLDVDLCTRMRKNGYRIVNLDKYKAVHLKIVKMGEEQTNQGVHQIAQV